MKILCKSRKRLYPLTLIFTILTTILGSHSGTLAQNSGNNKSLELLLSRLNLGENELEQIISPQGINDQSGDKLLEYFRNRGNIKHPVNEEHNLPSISEKELKYANDALKHVFVGQPAYPSYFCGEEINWNSSPVPDKEWVWQLNRMYFWNAMGKVYSQTKDEKYAKEWCDQLLSWVQKNPNDEGHKYAWRSIETGIRGRSWMSLFHRFVGSKHFTPEVLVAFMNSCFDHAEFLMTKYRSNSNWGLMEAEGMAFIAITFPEFKNSIKWRTEAFRRLNKEIDIQVYSDGHQRELAMGYHLGCIGWFLRTYELAELNGLENAFPPSYLDKIEKMCEVPMKLCLPDGTNVQFGDAWAGTPGQHNEKFIKWSNFFERKDFLFMATEGQQGNAPTSTAFALKESGIFSMRSNWNKDAICLVLKCGPDGGGHCQPDNTSFDVYAGGRNLMPDSGSYIYSGNPKGRKWFRQSKVHQTLTLNGQNTAYNPKLILWKPGKELDLLIVENISYENLKHRRAVFFIDNKYFVIVDEAIGSATGDIDIHFQLAPGEIIMDSKNLNAKSNFKKGWNVLVQSMKQKNLRLEEEEGQVSFEYTRKESRPAFRFRLNKSSERTGIRFITIVAPYQSSSPDFKINLVGKSEIGSSKMEIEVKVNGRVKRIGYNLKEE